MVMGLMISVRCFFDLNREWGMIVPRMKCLRLQSGDTQQRVNSESGNFPDSFSEDSPARIDRKPQALRLRFLFAIIPHSQIVVRHLFFWYKEEGKLCCVIKIANFCCRKIAFWLAPQGSAERSLNKGRLERSTIT